MIMIIIYKYIKKNYRADMGAVLFYIHIYTHTCACVCDIFITFCTNISSIHLPSARNTKGSYTSFR